MICPDCDGEGRIETCFTHGRGCDCHCAVLRCVACIDGDIRCPECGTFDCDGECDAGDDE